MAIAYSTSLDFSFFSKAQVQLKTLSLEKAVGDVLKPKKLSWIRSQAQKKLLLAGTKSERHNY